MNNREKFDAMERKIELVAKAGYRCEKCGTAPGPDKLQLAHRIMQARVSGRVVKEVQKYVLETYNQEITREESENILNHDFNLAVSCADCNSSFNIYNNPMEANALIRKICNDIYGWSEEV